MSGGHDLRGAFGVRRFIAAFVAGAVSVQSLFQEFVLLTFYFFAAREDSTIHE